MVLPVTKLSSKRFMSCDRSLDIRTSVSVLTNRSDSTFALDRDDLVAHIFYLHWYYFAVVKSVSPYFAAKCLRFCAINDACYCLVYVWAL